MLMGVRVYAPVMGRFLQIDPVYGGNESTYGYPNNPITMFDLDGRMSLSFKWAKQVVKGRIKKYAGKAGAFAHRNRYNAIMMMIPGGGGWGIRAGVWGARGAKVAWYGKQAIRVGRSGPYDHRQVSMGPTKKYWDQMDPRGRSLMRRRFHIDRRYCGYDNWVNTKKSREFYRRY